MLEKYQEDGLYRHVQGPAPEASRLRPVYEPVSCDFSDELEDLSVRRRYVDVAHWGEGAELVRATGRIVDIFTTAEKEEYLKLDDGTIVRLDRIFEVRSHRPREEERVA